MTHSEPARAGADAYDNMVAWMSMNAPYHHMMTFKAALERSASPAPAAGVEAVREAWSFLQDRLIEFEAEIGSGDEEREWAGHVHPALSRFNTAMAVLASPAATSAETQGGDGVREAGLLAAWEAFQPLAQIAFLWADKPPREGEVDRYREAYHRMMSAALAPSTSAATKGEPVDLEANFFAMTPREVHAALARPAPAAESAGETDHSGDANKMVAPDHSPDARNMVSTCGPRAERLKELLLYDPVAGVFTWKVSRGRQAAGNVAGAISGRGYVDISIDGRVYKAHRLAWLYAYGSHPMAVVDHINGDKTDYRLANLRACTMAENGQNRAKAKKAKSSFLGVSLIGGNRAKPWRATICAGGRPRHIGTFRTEHEAYAAYKEAKALLHTFNPAVRVSS